MKLIAIALCAISSVLCFPATAQDKKPLSKDAKARTEKAEQGDAGRKFWDQVFVEDHVLDVQIEMARADWDAMQPERGRRGGGRDAPRVRFDNTFRYAKAKVTVDGEVFEVAGLRFKGNSSFRASKQWKKPMKIDLNRFTKGQKLHGRTKINLSNAFLDPAFMKEKLAYELYRAAGMATPGVGWANVTLTVQGQIEKKRLGIYVLIEQVDKGYIERSFGEKSKGSLLMKPEALDDWEYLGREPAAYERYDIKIGEDNVDQIRAFADILRLIERGSDEDFAREIGKRMDLGQLAGYLAATSILANIDSYIGMPHNYYLLLDKADNKLRLLPWDLNEAFGTFTMRGGAEEMARWNIDRPWVSRRRLLERLFKTQTFPKRYRAAVENLMREHFTEKRLSARIKAFESAIEKFVARDKAGGGTRSFRMGIDGDGSGMNRAVGRKIMAIKPFLRKRIQSIRAQLAGQTDGVTLGRSRRR